MPAAAWEASEPIARRSTRQTEVPREASSSATAQPMMPPPNTTTSNRLRGLLPPVGDVRREIRGVGLQHVAPAAQQGIGGIAAGQPVPSPVRVRGAGEGGRGHGLIDLRRWSRRAGMRRLAGLKQRLAGSHEESRDQAQEETGLHICRAPC